MIYMKTKHKIGIKWAYFDNYENYYKLHNFNGESVWFPQFLVDNVRSLIDFVYSEDGIKLKEIIISPDEETRLFGYELYKVMGPYIPDAAKEIIYHAFLWS